MFTLHSLNLCCNIFIFDRRSNRIFLKNIDRYSIEKDAWEEFSADGPIMSCMASCTLNDQIYFGGGKNINWSKVSDFYTINVKTKCISKKANVIKMFNFISKIYLSKFENVNLLKVAHCPHNTPDRGHK